MQLIWILAVILFSEQAISGEIAITFDDAPTKDSVIMTGAERSTLITQALQDSSVPDALFFVKTSAINSTTEKRLQQYISSGYHLANHGHKHLSADKTLIGEFLQDIELSHEALKPFDNTLSFFRFPFLHYGKDKPSINNLQSALAKLGYKNGYVTVDNYDWYMNAILKKAKKEGKDIDYEKFGEIYVSVIWQAIEFYDNIAKTSLGRSPKHVLLLHENDTSALYLNKLIQHIRKNGWTIISPQEAYQDAISNKFPKGLFHKQGRVAAFAHDAGVAIENLRHSSENQDYLEFLFEQEGVFK